MLNFTKMYVILIFLPITVIADVLNYQQLISRLDGRSRNEFDSKLKYLTSIGEPLPCFKVPSYTNSDCLQFVHRSSYFDSLCSIPPHCGAVNTTRYDKGLFGDDYELCYGLGTEHRPLKSYYLEIPEKISINEGTSELQVYHFPLRFFFLLYDNSKYRSSFSLLPSICMNLYKFEGSPILNLHFNETTKLLQIYDYPHLRAFCEPYDIGEHIDYFFRYFPLIVSTLPHIPDNFTKCDKVSFHFASNNFYKYTTTSKNFRSLVVSFNHRKFPIAECDVIYSRIDSKSDVSEKCCIAHTSQVHPFILHASELRIGIIAGIVRALLSQLLQLLKYLISSMLPSVRILFEEIFDFVSFITPDLLLFVSIAYFRFRDLVIVLCLGTLYLFVKYL